MKNKVLVFGIDGASWPVLALFTKKGLMPNLAKIIKTGTKGVIESPFPPSTATCWASFATSTNPGKHSCYGFFKVGDDFNHIDLYTSRDIKGKTFYEILEEAGKRSILVNLPGSFPPKIKNGVVVSSFLNPSQELYYPRSLVNKYPQLAKYQVFPDLLKEGASEAVFTKEVRKIESNRFEVGKDLFLKEKWDFFFYLISGGDWLLHRMGENFFKGKFTKFDPIAVLFQEIDQYLGWFWKANQGNLSFLISDHGFKLYQGEFYINQWLKEKGWLNTKHLWYLDKNQFPLSKIEAVLAKKIKNPFLKSMGKLALKIRPSYALFGWLVRTFPSLFPSLSMRNVGTLGLGVDNLKTKVYSSGNFCYIRDQRGVKDLRKQVINELKELRIPGTKRKVFQAVLPREENYWGPYVGEAPDLILERGDYCPNSEVNSQQAFTQKKQANHSSQGIFLVSGPGVKKRRKNVKVRLEDLGPTILDYFSIEKAEGMDGEVLKQILE